MMKLSKPLSILIITFLIGVLAVAVWFCFVKTQTTQMLLPNAAWEPIFFKSINEVTEQAKLTELRKINLHKGDIEVRVWRGLSTESLEGVILKRTKNQWSAMHLAKSFDDAEKVNVRKLDPPKSGWESFWRQLVDKEILTLPDASEIECGNGGIDGGSNVVEINQNKTYRTFRLSDAYSSGKCRQANQMEEIADIIVEEFYSGTEQCKRAEWFACTKARKSNKKQNQ